MAVVLEAEASEEQDIHGRSSECKLEEPWISYFFPGMGGMRNPRKNADERKKERTTSDETKKAEEDRRKETRSNKVDKVDRTRLFDKTSERSAVIR